MNFKFSKKLILYIFAFICLFLTIFLIRETYARYVTTFTAQSYAELGRWLLLVNDQNILENSDFSDNVTPNFEDANGLIAIDKIAPSSKGFIDVTIDYSNVTVPFEYELTLAADEATSLEDFSLTNYSIDDTVMTFDGVSIKNTVTPDNITTTQTIKLNFEWVEGEGEALNNIQDTNFSRNFSEIIYHLNINFTQTQAQT